MFSLACKYECSSIRESVNIFSEDAFNMEIPVTKQKYVVYCFLLSFALDWSSQTVFIYVWQCRSNVDRGDGLCYFKQQILSVSSEFCLEYLYLVVDFTVERTNYGRLCRLH